MRKIVCYIAVFLLISCQKEDKKNYNTKNLFLGKFNVVEKFKIIGGTMTGTIGKGEYIIELYEDKNDSNKILLYNFAGFDTVYVIKRNNNMTIPSQKIKSQNIGDVYINYGHGQFYNDSILYSFNSGSSSGIIESLCNGIKIK
jgi:hypothetical protein